MLSRRLILVAVLTPLAALAGCGSGPGPGPGRSGERMDVVTSFYPLAYVTQRIAGNLAAVSNLTKPGAEPHDLELTPREVAHLADADLVVFLSRFQPAVDKAVRAEAGGSALDVASPARLDRRVTQEENGRQHTGADPHFWLDPTRLADVGDAVAQRLAKVDPGDAATFTAGAARLRSDLQALDAAFRTGLANCANRTIVTSHQAFGYLARRYGLEQVGIAGLSPEAEPDAATLARVADYVRAHKVRTIYYETLVSPDIAGTVAAETGARTAVLDPIEGLTATTAAQDYLGVMRADLAALESGQPCPSRSAPDRAGR